MPLFFSILTLLQPERYIHDGTNNTESANLPNPYERDHWMFGAGRRICPGMLVAEREIWLTIARMLWAFDMKAIPGEPIDLREYDGLSGRSPMPFSSPATTTSQRSSHCRHTSILVCCSQS